MDIGLFLSIGLFILLSILFYWITYTYFEVHAYTALLEILDPEEQEKCQSALEVFRSNIEMSKHYGPLVVVYNAPSMVKNTPFLIKFWWIILAPIVAIVGMLNKQKKTPRKRAS